MEKLLVILHLYYHEQLEYFLDKMRNINGCEWDLIVTYSKSSHESEEKIFRFKHDARLIKVENVGYDIWPFIKIIKTIDLSNYNYILKLHTKGSMPYVRHINKVNLYGWRWRDMLVNSILGSRFRFSRCLSNIRKDKVGMVCCYEMLKKTDGILPEDTTLLVQEGNRVGIDISSDLFCAGTIFLIKSKVLAKIQNADLNIESWGTAHASLSTGSTAHVYERLISMAAHDAGYKIKGIVNSLKTGLISLIYKLTH